MLVEKSYINPLVCVYIFFTAIFCWPCFQRIQDVLKYEVVPSNKLEEFYTVNVEDIMKRFKHGIEGRCISGKGSMINSVF